MSESIPNPWICSYCIDVAESYGAKLYNAPVFQRKKRVQLTEFLTYQDNSYVWAWASDKEYRISIRIEKDAVDDYKRSVKLSASPHHPSHPLTQLTWPQPRRLSLFSPLYIKVSTYICSSSCRWKHNRQHPHFTPLSLGRSGQINRHRRTPIRKPPGSRF
ncbi:hypothetical protein PAXRUDRAFT_798762 [Paxillus rubicundulus Ve08.2h10]|uniref:Uncharacterized protein n=1 Tax=Paxillus rubicundulus Ve08.2h10 TaxID=930991 RepID=A0A0D0ED91_9AGAM|nr:hypothetical protein PAXRUDRAFT_798762 [Paxillus rubicundulus Ve08.2h10]